MRAQRLRNEDGVGLVATALVLTALMAASAVGLNLGRVAFTATEVQTIAEIAATAGAMAKLTGRTDGEAIAEAQQVVHENRVDGQTATISASDIEFGNFSDGTFTPGGAPANAVRATANAIVTNLFAPLSIPGIFTMDQTSNVQKRAIATFSSLGSGQPALPLGLCDCEFSEDCYDDSCLPGWAVDSNSDNFAFTGFTTGNSQNDIMSFIPSDCGGGGMAAPELIAASDTNSGTTIHLNNGELTPVFVAVRCMVCQLGMCTPESPCLVPVFSCTCPGQLNQTAEVAGFSEIAIDSFHCTGGGPDGQTCGCESVSGQVDGINFHSVFRTNATGTPGGGNFGVGFVVLVG